MNFNTFDKLLRKNISEAHKVIDSTFKSSPDDHSIYFYSNESYKYFYNMPAYYISINNNNNIIDSITFYFLGIIDEQFYKKFTNDYGNPDTIQIIENEEILSKGKNTEDSDFFQYLEKSFFTTREGTFNENPLYMIWNKEEYHIKVFLRHQQNISEITFSIPTDEN